MYDIYEEKQSINSFLKLFHIYKISEYKIKISSLDTKPKKEKG